MAVAALLLIVSTVRIYAYENFNSSSNLDIAQESSVSGIIISSEDNVGLPGVNVVIKGSSHGTVTDIDGNFNIDVPSQETVLVFSSIGFVTEEVSVGGQSVINVSMVPDITALDEIVVVGYGTQEKKDVTGSISSVSSETLEK